MFLGRIKELNELNNRYETNKFEFGIIYGSRRIGKTSLINEFLKGKDHIYFQARQVSDYENITKLSSVVAKYFGLPNRFRFNDFDEVLEYINDNIGETKLVLVFDEYSYFDNSKNGYSSSLQYYIDSKFNDKKIKLILSGSNISFMKELMDKSAPLYQRQTFVMHLIKMPFKEAILFLKDINDNEEKVKYLSLFGNSPYYLSMINKEKSFNENVYDLLYSEYGTLQNATDNVLSQVVRNQNVYNSLLIALSKRKRTIKDISDTVHEDSRKVEKYLATLSNSEIVEKRESFSGNKKMNYYVISDPLLRFWYLFIFDRKDEIELGFGKEIYKEDGDKINDFISHSFEDVAISYMTQLNMDGKLGSHYSLFKNYKVDNSKLGRSIEIDGLATSKDKLIVVECKYRKEKFSIEMLNHLKESASIFKGYTRIEYYLFSKSGFKRELENEENIHLVSLDKMFI